MGNKFKFNITNEKPMGIFSGCDEFTYHDELVWLIDSIVLDSFISGDDDCCSTDGRKRFKLKRYHMLYYCIIIY